MDCKEQAKKIYVICIAKAKDRKALTYKEVLCSLGYKPNAKGNAIQYGLKIIQIACRNMDLLDVTSIIVTKKTGQPAGGGHSPEKLKNDQLSVFEHQKWPSVDEIDWDYVWENRNELSKKYGTKDCWINRPSDRIQGSRLDLYNNRVGNKGDVCKHFILCNVTNILLQSHNANQPFVYVDTHCSLGHFPLIVNGQWQQGIGRFFGQKWRPLPDYPYFKMEEETYKTCNQYLGSWKLVERLLADRKIKGDLQLFDTSKEVDLQLRKMRGFKHSDGFEAIQSGLTADLYFVDPAYSEHRDEDWKRVTEVIKKLCKQGANALIWYPVFIKKRPIEDLSGVVIAEVQWPASGANQEMRGCGMVATGDASGILHKMEKTLEQLAKALSGKLFLLDKRSPPKTPPKIGFDL
ncbi:MAG: 23S rRNA (adenine(2030)-N(6))-methyltransferase RlmJ [Desulfobaccales bacterium]